MMNSSISKYLKCGAWKRPAPYARTRKFFLQPPTHNDDSYHRKRCLRATCHESIAPPRTALIARVHKYVSGCNPVSSTPTPIVNARSATHKVADKPAPTTKPKAQGTARLEDTNNLKTTATIQKIVPAAIAITAMEKSGPMYPFPRPISAAKRCLSNQRLSRDRPLMAGIRLRICREVLNRLFCSVRSTHVYPAVVSALHVCPPGRPLNPSRQFPREQCRQPAETD